MANLSNLQTESKVQSPNFQLKQSWMGSSAKERAKHLEDMNSELVRENKERRRVDSELTLVSMVAQKTDTGVIITDKNRKTVWINKAFTRTTGYTLKEMYGKSPGNLET